MFKAIAFTALLIFSQQINAFISFDSALSGLSTITGGVDSSVDLLESSSDLLDEISDESSDLGQFTKDISTYNRNMKDLEGDMRYLGYSEDDIARNLQKLGSNKHSLEQKMRALTKSVKSVKKMKALISKLTAIAAAKGGGGPDPSSQAMLANQQQLLHLQIQQQKNDEMNDLDKKMTEMAFKKSIALELDKARIDLIKSKENSSNKSRVGEWSMQLGDIQKKVIQISLCLCVLGCLGLMVSFFRDEGIKTLKAGFLGVVLAYLLPSVITLYSRWLGV